MKLLNFSYLFFLSLVSCQSSLNFERKDLFSSKNGILFDIQTPIYSIKINSKDSSEFTLLSCDTFFRDNYNIIINYGSYIIRPEGFYLDTSLEYSIFLSDRDTIEYLFGKQKLIADLSFKKNNECDFIFYEGNQVISNKEILHFIKHFDTLNLPGIIKYSKIVHKDSISAER